MSAKFIHRHDRRGNTDLERQLQQVPAFVLDAIVNQPIVNNHPNPALLFLVSEASSEDAKVRRRRAEPSM
jgi:hypothetical protein